MKIPILNVPVSQLDYVQVLKRIDEAIKLKKNIYVCVSAVHLLMECQNNQKLLNGVQAADIVTLDGMPLVWLSKFYGNKKATRVYGPNLSLMLCRLAEQRHFSVFLLGGAVGQSEHLKQKLQKQFPNLRIVGNADTPARPIPPNENQAVISKIKKTKPDIVFVGMGCPNQELWMIENRSQISVPVLIGVGAAFDFITGKVKQAPGWMQNNGLEWLFRLVQEPRRLFKRYVILNTIFVTKVTKQVAVDLLKKL